MIRKEMMMRRLKMVGAHLLNLITICITIAPTLSSTFIISMQLLTIHSDTHHPFPHSLLYPVALIQSLFSHSSTSFTHSVYFIHTIDSSCLSLSHTYTRHPCTRLLSKPSSISLNSPPSHIHSHTLHSISHSFILFFFV